jgi:hypothetical protein
MDDEEHTSAFLAMSWQLPPELEMPPALSSLPWENEQSTEAAPAEATEAPHPFPPEPPDDVEELTHTYP